MPKPTILCDVDGILVDWTSRFPYFLEKKGIPTEKAIALYAHGQFVSLEEITGLDSEAAAALSDEYCQSKFMKYLTPYKDALLAVNLLKHKYDFVAVTALNNHPMTVKMREENLEFWFPGAFKEVIATGYCKSKYEALCKFDPTVFIDDTPSHIREGLQAGHQCIRIVRDARQCVAPAYIARDWNEASNIIHRIL